MVRPMSAPTDNRLSPELLTTWREGVRARLTTHEISVRDLAKRCECSESSLRNWLSKGSGPHLAARLRIESELDKLDKPDESPPP